MNSHGPAKKTMTVNALGTQGIESIGNEVYDAECLKLINEYFYGVRIYPGQDPTHVRNRFVLLQFIKASTINAILCVGLPRLGNNTISLA